MGREISVKNILKNGEEARFCKELFVNPKSDHEGESIFERLRWGKLLFAGVILYLGFSFVTGCYTIVDLKMQENHLMQSSEDAIKQTKIMKERVAWMHTDDAVQTIAREELGMVKPGEILITQTESNG